MSSLYRMVDGPTHCPSRTIIVAYIPRLAYSGIMVAGNSGRPSYHSTGGGIMPLEGLYLGDCLSILPTMATASIDAVVTDPPWNLGYFEDDDKPWAQYCDWLAGVRDECLRVASKSVWIFQSSKAIPYVSHLFQGWDCFAALKNFSQMTPTKLPNAWDIAFYNSSDGYNGNGRNWYKGNTAGMLSERTGHPTPRTTDTMLYILAMFDWESVIDPFMGSGTTGVACARLGRKFIGIERDPTYFAIAEKRIGEARSQLIMELA